MDDTKGGILGELYGGMSETHPEPGRVLITSPPAESSSTALVRLKEDLGEVLVRSGFVVAQYQTRDQELVAEVTLGSAVPLTQAPSVYASYDGWHMSVSDEPSHATYEMRNFNTITSLLTASIAVSEVFRMRFGTELALSQRTKAREGGLFDFVDPTLSFPLSLDFEGKTISWFGCGSLAYAACFALRGIQLGNVRFHMVDSDIMRQKNVRKYLGVHPEDLGRLKAAVLGEKLTRLGAAAEAFKFTLNAYSRKVNFQIPFAIVSTDTSISRRDLQAKLPKVVVNAWTSNDRTMLQAGAYRYEMSRGGACLVCQYREDVEGHPDLAELALRSKIDPLTFAEAIRENEPLPGKNVPENVAGLRFMEGYRTMCDAFQIPRENLRQEFSVPFVAGIGGALLAFTLVCEGSHLLEDGEPLRNQLRFVLSPDLSYLFTDQAAQRADCICTDQAYVQTYKEKW